MEIIAVNNILKACQAHQIHGGPFTYSPSCVGLAQVKFHKKRFQQIKNKIFSATLRLNSRMCFSAGSLVFAWDSWFEKIKHNGNLATESQNRLFSKGTFSNLKSFSTFRKEAESQLPELYGDTFEPFDQDVIDHIDYYFYRNKFPSTYFETRNEMVSFSASSKVSAYLSCGALDVKYLYNEIKKFEQRVGANKSTYWLIFELLWREYFYWHYQLWQRHYFSLNGINDSLKFTNYKRYKIDELLELSQHPFWLSSLNELIETGFPTNRTRQLFASFWVHELRLDWRSGAQFYQDHLIDYDVYSNWGNWMYIAGVGANSRGARKFNIDAQIDHYDPQGQYYNLWN